MRMPCAWGARTWQVPSSFMLVSKQPTDVIVSRNSTRLVSACTSSTISSTVTGGGEVGGGGGVGGGGDGDGAFGGGGFGGGGVGGGGEAAGGHAQTSPPCGRGVGVHGR